MIPLLDAIPVVGKLVDRLIGLIPDPQKKAELQLEYQKLIDGKENKLMDVLSTVDAKQAEINMAETNVTGSTWFKLFMAGWRPALGWVCTFAFTWAFVLQPICIFILKALHNPMEVPRLDIGELITVLVGMLGLSTQRMIEKKSGVQENH